MSLCELNLHKVQNFEAEGLKQSCYKNKKQNSNTFINNLSQTKLLQQMTSSVFTSFHLQMMLHNWALKVKAVSLSVLTTPVKHNPFVFML